jgi:hypothetical protein
MNRDRWIPYVGVAVAALILAATLIILRGCHG